MAVIPGSTRKIAGQFFDKGGACLNVMHPEFGAKGDGINDDTAAIQAAIDASIAASEVGLGLPVYLPGGKYKTTDTLFLGKKNVPSFRSVVLFGDGYKYAGQNGFPGPTILPTQTDRPAVNFQGARGSVIKGVSIVGLLYNYITTNNFCRTTAPLPVIDDTLAANWDDPALGGAALDSRYAPYAAIAIDGWAGAQPATHYPTGSQAYGQNFSSDVLIEDCYIRGFTVAVVNQPCDADGNGDFTKLRRVNIEYCKWGISVGNTQARSMALDDVIMNGSYCALTNNKHGRQNGKFGGLIKNLSVGSCTKVFEFGALSYAGPLTFENLYGEALWQIGSTLSPTSVENSIAFRQGQVSFDQHVPSRGYPAYVFELNGSGITDVLFDGFQFTGYNSIVGFRGLGFRFDGVITQQANARPGTYEKFAHNATVGGIIFSFLGRASSNPMHARVRTTSSYNLDTGAGITQEYTDRIFQSDRARCIPWWGEGVSARNASHDNMPMPFREAWAQPKNLLAAISLVGSTLSITFPASRSEYLFNQYGPLPGDVMWDDLTGTVFFVRSRVGDVVLAEIQSNYKIVGGVATPIAAFSTVAGNLYIRSSRVYTPPYFLRGDTTVGNAVITNCARDDGFAAWYDAEIVVGDYMLLDEEQDRFITNVPDTLIAGRNQAAGTITLNGASMRATQVRRRLALFSRLPPANV